MNFISIYEKARRLEDRLSKWIGKSLKEGGPVEIKEDNVININTNHWNG